MTASATMLAGGWGVVCREHHLCLTGYLLKGSAERDAEDHNRHAHAEEMQREIDAAALAWDIGGRDPQQASAEDAEALAVIVNPPPERIVRSSVLRHGAAYEIPGTQFADGLPRLIVAEAQELAEETVRAYS